MLPYSLFLIYLSKYIYLILLVSCSILQSGEKPVFVITQDGQYQFSLSITTINDEYFRANVHIEMRASYGYLSAADFPLLPVSLKILIDNKYSLFY